MAYSIAVDIGGTFTDCVVVDGAGQRTVAKALTRYGALEEGVLESLDVIASQLNCSRQELLSETTTFIHGTTQATNALVTHTGATVGLITTHGHEDVLRIGRVYSKIAGLTERDIVHSSRLAKPAPLVRQDLVIGVNERVDCDGDVICPLSEDEVIAAIDTLVAAGAEAIAVSFLWSFANDAHERTVQRLLAERAPHVFAAISCDVAPVLGEYERTATTVVNAYVGPRVNVYLRTLEEKLCANALQAPLLVMQASGGLTSVGDASSRPVVTLDSGPTGGILGSQALGRLYGEPNVICTDVGGTSFDVGLVLDDELPIDNEPVVARYSLRLPKVLVESIGSGGGSIAWVDQGGLLRVGPQSARSNPGPACYGLGGEQPTVTDADLVLGYLDPDAFLGGRMALDRDLALEALARVGKRLGLEPEEVAIGVFRIINSQMADLIRKLTIEQGHDPRDCVLAAYGGAGPTHAAFYGHDIGAKAIIVPARSTAFSAEGMLACDIAHTVDASKSMRSPLTAGDLEAMHSTLTRLENRIREQFRAEGTPDDDVDIARSVGVRFRRQVQTLMTPVDSGPLGPEAGDVIAARFSERYGKLYGGGALLSGGGIEIDLHRVVGTRRVGRLPVISAEPEGPDARAALKRERPVFFEHGGYRTTPVYRGELLRPGNEINGPAVIERMGDSVVVPPGYVAVVDHYLSLRLLRTAPATTAGPSLTSAQGELS
ncbi:hydantoinase/oxoprolinase family protein [Streptomyces sp. NPDC002928]|uniref:hydantoinase/oxoprolinase family protein n=1 Tax=Streptomyces sp. NPDC002928 TaxID=3154440 RepID=UPI0033B82463